MEVVLGVEAKDHFYNFIRLHWNYWWILALWLLDINIDKHELTSNKLVFIQKCPQFCPQLGSTPLGVEPGKSKEI